MPCSVCQHPQRQDIDQALMSGGTLAAVSQQYNLSTSALHRHKAHLQAKSAGPNLNFWNICSRAASFGSARPWK